MSKLESHWGKARTFLVTVTDGGTPVDLTAKTLRFTAKSSVEDPDPPLVTKTTGAGITHLTQSGATIGQARIKIDPADTRTHSDVHPARTSELVWDLELIDSGDTFVVDSGEWTVLPSVRRT